MQIVEGIVLF